MNDDTDKPLNTVGDDALEARITAWVLGEASSFEAGELEKLCAADPALGLFERRLRVLHGLVAEDFKAGPAAEWKLGAERRAKITDLLGVEPEVEQVLPRRERHRGSSVRGLILALAACVVIGLVSYSLLGGVGQRADIAMMKESARVVNYSAPAPDAMAEVEALRSERGSLRVEREGGAPAKKPTNSYEHLANNSAFTAKPPPPAIQAAQDAPDTTVYRQARAGVNLADARSASGQPALDGVDRSNPGAGTGGPLPSAAMPVAPAAEPGSGLASHTASDGNADLQRAENSLALLKEKAAKGGAAGMPEQKWVTRSEVEGIAGPPPAPATPAPAPAAEPAALAANEAGELGFGYVMGGSAAGGAGGWRGDARTPGGSREGCHRHRHRRQPEWRRCDHAEQH
jgi:hypothetical protein